MFQEPTMAGECSLEPGILFKNGLANEKHEMSSETKKLRVKRPPAQNVRSVLNAVQ